MHLTTLYHTSLTTYLPQVARAWHLLAAQELSDDVYDVRFAMTLKGQRNRDAITHTQGFH